MNRALVLGAIAALAAIALALFFFFSNNAAPTGPGAGQALPGASSVDVSEGSGTPENATLRQAAEVSTEWVDDGSDPVLEGAKSGFRGRVVSSAGAPVADCGVRIFRLALDSFAKPGFGDLMGDELAVEPDLLAGEAQTASDGRFEITGVWPRAIYMIHAGLGTDNPTHRLVRQTPAPGEIVDLGDVVLEDAGVIVGQVVNQQGEPVPDARVWAADVPGQIASFVPLHSFDPRGFIVIEEGPPFQVLELPPWVERVVDEFPVPQARTDTQGNFRLTGVKPGQNLLAVNKPGLVPLLRPTVRVRAGEVKDLRRLVLMEGEELVARVVDSQGDPVEGAEVIAGPKISVAPVPVAHAISVGTSDASGTVYALGFPRGDVLVAARRGPGHSWVLGEVVNVNQDAEVVLPAETRMVVRVTDAEGVTIERPRLRVVPGQQREGAPEMMLMGFVQPLDLANRLERGDDGEQVVRGLIPGKYMVLADAPGHAIAAANVDLSLDEEAEVTLTLQGKIDHPVVVTTWDGKPVRNARIYAQGRGDRVSGVPVDAGRTGGDGRRTVTEVDTEEVRISAEHPAYGIIHGEHKAGEPELALQFQQPGSIEGVLLENGRPAELGEWTVVAMPRGQRTRGATESTPPLATPDLSGRFAFKALQPGTYRVATVDFVQSITSPGSMVTTMMGVFQTGRFDPATAEVEVVPGGVHQVQLDAGEKIYDGPGAQITGTAFVNGRPAEGATARTRTSEGLATAQVDAYGNFDLGRVPEGKHTVTLFEMPQGNWFARSGQTELGELEVEIVDGANQSIEFRVDTGSVAGFVRAPGGAILESPAMVMLRKDGLRLNSEVDSRGRFSFDKVPVGADYRIEVRALGEDGFSHTESGVTVQVAATTNVDITLSDTYSVSGTLNYAEIAGDEQRVRLFLFMEPAGDREGATGICRVRSEGTFATRGGLQPGTYTAKIRGRNGEWICDTPVVVVDRDIEGLNLVFRRDDQAKGDGR